jgi:hypothetical protein
MVRSVLSDGGIPRNVAFLPDRSRGVVTNQSGYVTWIR